MIEDPPILVVEVLSPDDSYTDIMNRSEDYRRMGVRAVWLIDPETRTGRMLAVENPIEGPEAEEARESWMARQRLTVPGTAVYLELPHLFRLLDEGSKS